MSLEALKEKVIAGQAGEVEKLTKEAIDGGIKAQDILRNALIPAMDTVVLTD